MSARRATAIAGVGLGILSKTPPSIVLIVPITTPSGVKERGDQPRLKLCNATTVAIGDESAMNFVPFIALFLANFAKSPKGEVRRIPILRGWVNRGREKGRGRVVPGWFPRSSPPLSSHTLATRITMVLATTMTRIYHQDRA
jgi:hypothetical protein